MGFPHLEPYIKEVMTMDKQTIQFATVNQGNVIQRVGNSTIEQPKTNFTGGSIKFYENKRKKVDKK